MPYLAFTVSGAFFIMESAFDWALFLLARVSVGVEEETLAVLSLLPPPPSLAEPLQAANVEATRSIAAAFWMVFISNAFIGSGS
jgi:hypothetical protein